MVLTIWIAVVSTIAALGGVWAIFQMQYHWRLRRPVFKVKRGRFNLRYTPGEHPYVQEGKIVLNVRGARWPITLTHQQFFWGQVDNVTTGQGLERNVTLPPEISTPMELEGIGLPLVGDPPPFLDCVLYFADDHDFSEKLSLRLNLAGDGSHYFVRNEVGLMHMMRTIVPREPFRRRVSRRIHRAFRSLKGLIVKQ